MSPEEFLCERILLMLSSYPQGFKETNEYISLLLWAEEELVDQVLKEMIETGLVYRWINKEENCRILSLLPKKSSSSYQSIQRLVVLRTLIEPVASSSFFIPSILLLRSSINNINNNNNNTSSIKNLNTVNSRFTACGKKEENKISEVENKESIKSKTPPIPAIIKEIVELWNEKGLSNIPIKRTKRFNRIWSALNKARNGSLFINDYRLQSRKFTALDIMNSIKNFSSAAYNSECEVPSWLRKYYRTVDLDNFCYNPHASTEGGLSYLLHFQNPPKMREDLKEDEYPQISSVFRNFYLKEALGSSNIKILAKEENRLREGAKRTVEFFKENKSKFMMSGFLGELSAVKVATWVCEAILWDRERFTENTIPLTAGFFCSDMTFSRRLPAYLKHQGIWE